MKTLTAITAVLMPPTLLAGIYGMNFEILPGLHSVYGHYLIFLLMVSISLGMVLLLKKKRWI
jgi:magnesium transporter